jgi:hypothetical protein
MTDLIILAIDTTEVAGREKYVSGTVLPRDGWFLTKMGSIMSDKDLIGYAAKAPFVAYPVDLACPRAELTIFKHFLSSIH